MTRKYKDIQYTLKRSKRKTASIYIERDGAVSVLVPENSMHSFSAEHNQISWMLRVRSRTPWLPGLTRTTAVVVLPRSIETTEDG